MARKLNPKQRKFAAEYAKTGNATKAAISAGYSERSAYSQAHDLLKKPEITTAVDRSHDRQIAKIDITAENVLGLIRDIAFDPTTAKSTKLKATDQLGRHLKLFTQLVETKVEAKVDATVRAPTPEELEAALEKAEKKC